MYNNFNESDVFNRYCKYKLIEIVELWGEGVCFGLENSKAFEMQKK